MDRLAQLQQQANDSYQQIEQLRGQFHDQGQKWQNDEQRAAWETANQTYNDASREMAEIRAAAEIDERWQQLQEQRQRGAYDDLPSSARHGLAQYARDVRRAAETRGLALQAWAGHGQGRIRGSQRHQDAARECHIDPAANELPVEMLAGWEVAELLGHSRDSHPRLARSQMDRWRHDRERRALSFLTPSAGGVTLGETLVPTLEIAMLSYLGVMQVAEVIRTETAERISWPTADDTANEGSIIGENATIDSATDPTFAAPAWDAFEFSSGIVRAPRLLIESNPTELERALGEMLGVRIARRFNRAATVGSGGNEPVGLSTVAVQGKLAASATAIADTELIDLQHAVDPDYRMDAQFMAHDSIWASLRKLKDGQNRFIWRAGLAEGRPDTLLDWPALINQHMAASIVANARTILAGAMGKYKVRQVRTMTLSRLVERYADQNQIGFVSIWPMDGNLLDAGTGPVQALDQAAS